MLRFALTGGIACGKSLVGEFLVEREIPVCDTDKLAHALLQIGQESYHEIVHVFGQTFLRPDGNIDRSRLGRFVFSNDTELKKLNAILHPRVGKLWRAWVQTQQDEGQKAVVVMIPLLFEVGADDGWDGIICVTSPKAFQIERLLKRGLSKTEALNRIQAQLPIEDKAARADYVLNNDGSREALKEQTFLLLDRLLERE